MRPFGWIGIGLKIVSKASIFRIPLCGWVMSLIGHVPFDRRKPGGHVVTACQELVERGVSVFFFPRARGRRMEGLRIQAGRVRGRGARWVCGGAGHHKKHGLPHARRRRILRGRAPAAGRRYHGRPRAVVCRSYGGGPRRRLQERAREAIASRL